jgi:hypothetical protein
MKSLNSIVAPQFAISPELRLDWERQFRTADQIAERFDSGYRTQLLADEVGMGKTYVAMAAMAHHIYQTNENDRKVLLVVPNSSILSRKWGQELRSFNEQYLRRELRESCCKRLRPLEVEDYWDLIENLQDYVNEDLSRIPESMAQCMALFFQAWWEGSRRRKRSWLRDWPDVGNMSKGDPTWLDFSSRFSLRAFQEFMDGKALMDKVGMDRLVKALESGESRKEEIKALFRAFAKDQDAYEANVFVMTMKSLSKSRRNHAKSRLLNAWMTSRILTGRRTVTRERVLLRLQEENLVTRPDDAPKDYLRWFNGLGNADLWGMAKVFEDVVVELGGTATLFERFGEDSCVGLLGDLHDRVVRAKLVQAGIGLAVVDEAHNWKNGGNGARDFANAYAPYIKFKLLLSATPFQLEQSELGRIYSVAGGGAERFGSDLSLATVQSLLDDGLATECLRESQAFQKAWQSLSLQDVTALEDLATTGELDRILEASHTPLSMSGSLELFWNRFRMYAQAVGRLQGELSKVMLRHVKDRGHRHFHAGKDWLADNAPNEQILSHSFLYPVDGFAEPRHALLGYLGMRLVQKLRRGGGTGNARLLRGITSSFAAFQASNRETLDATDLPNDVRAYLEFFGKALEESRHPKVVATADRAFANYSRGRKTLIFCERVATLDEIESILTEKIATLFPDGIPAAQKRRTALLRRAGLVDLHWSRCLLQALAPDRRKALLGRWNAARADIIEAVLSGLAKAGEIATERRVGRMVDLELLARFDVADLPDWAQAFRAPSPENRRLLVEGTLSEDVESSGGAIDPDHQEEEEREAVARELVQEAVEGFMDRPNLWFHEASASFHKTLHELLSAEFSFLQRRDGDGGIENRSTAFFGMLVDLVQGMRKILLRSELFASLDLSSPDFEAKLLKDLWERPIALAPDASQWSRRTAGMRLEDFLRILAASEGTIQRRWKQDSKRKSLWSGVFLKHGESAGLVLTLDGKVATDTRVSRCAAFNSPLAPDILICTAIGAEGIDLHRYCAEVIHHDLPWNPAKLEQRIGRIDRVGSLTERNPGSRLLVGIPFLANDYESMQYQVLQTRAQRFEVLLGKPDFSLDVEEEDQDEKVLDKDNDEEFVEATSAVLPPSLLEHLRMDLRTVAA